MALLSLTLIGLTAYLLLFEVRPRYLFLYAPSSSFYPVWPLTNLFQKR